MGLSQIIAAAAPTLAHGNSEVERGFSDSDKTVTVDRSRLSEASINNLRIAADGLKVFGCLPNHFFIYKVGSISP